MTQNTRNSKEIEYKWQADSIRDYKLFLDLAQNLGAKLSKIKKVQIKDLYVDTPENFFQSSHLECRIRLSAAHSELTLKSFSGPNHTIFIRDEKTIPLPHFTLKQAALAHCRHQYFKSIEPLFEILNNRQIHTLILPCGTRAEASFDQVLMLGGEKKFRMHEIELEFKSGHLGKFKAFVKKLSPLSLNPFKASKFEMGLRHVVEASPSHPLGTLHDTANHILKMNVEKLKKSEVVVLKAFAPEAIHDMRVAIRRLRAALKSFKSILPAKEKKMRTELQKLGGVLGKKRDLDVFSEFILPTINAASASFPKLAQQIEKSQKQILSNLQSNSYANLIRSLKQLKFLTTQKNIFKVSLKLIRRALNRVLEIAPSIDAKVDDKTLHKLRIAIKKLRYICEFFEPLFRKYICPLSPFIEKNKKIQDSLGDHQDAITGTAMLIRHKKLFSLDEIRQLKKKYELKKKKARRLFFKIWKDFWVGNGFRRSRPSTAIELIL